MRKGFTVGDDSSVYVASHSACVPTISAALDLLVDLFVLPNKLLSGLIYFPFLGSQPLHPYVRWGRCSPFGSIANARVTSSSEALSTCPSEVSAMKHSREG